MALGREPYLRISWGSPGEPFWIPGDPETCIHVGTKQGPRDCKGY